MEDGEEIPLEQLVKTKEQRRQGPDTGGIRGSLFVKKRSDLLSIQGAEVT